MQSQKPPPQTTASAKYNLAFILLIGSTVLHLILGALFGPDVIAWAWLVSLLIPLYVAIKTKSSGLSKVVIFCILFTYVLLIAYTIFANFYYFPKKRDKWEKEIETMSEEIRIKMEGERPREPQQEQ